MLRLAVAALLVTMIYPVWAQETLTQEQVDQAAENIRKLRSSISLDRTTYFAGEVARITFRVENPTDGALVIPDPRRSSELTVACANTRCGMSDHDLFFGLNTRLLTLQPGGVIEFTLRSSDNLPGTDNSVEPIVEPYGTVPIEADHATFSGFWGRAEFDVVAPRVTQIVTAQFSPSLKSAADEGAQATGLSPKTVDSSIRPEHLFINAMVLESDTERAIVVSHRWHYMRPQIRGPRDRPLGFGDVSELKPFHRIATASGPVQNLQISLPKGTEELIEVRWQEGNQKHVVALDKQREPIQQ